MKSNQTIIRKNLMEQLNFVTNLLGIKDKNIIILDYLDAGTHKEVIAKLDYPAPKCHNIIAIKHDLVMTFMPTKSKLT